MSNPIADNVEYFIEKEKSDQLKRTDSYQQQEGEEEAHHHSFTFGLHTIHNYAQRHNVSFLDNSSHTSSSSNKSNSNSQDLSEEESTYLAKQWHSLIRRMSVNIQRNEGTPEHAIRTGTPLQPTEHEKQLMLNIPIPPAMDDHLPSIDEVVKKNAHAVKMAELKPSYFEHPFESDEDNYINNNNNAENYPKNDDHRVNQHYTINQQQQQHEQQHYKIDIQSSTTIQPNYYHDDDNDNDTDSNNNKNYNNENENNYRNQELFTHPLDRPPPILSSNFNNANNNINNKVSPDHPVKNTVTFLPMAGITREDSDQNDGKTNAMEKMRINNSLTSNHNRRASMAPHMWTKYPLVPYYPPLFAVPHISFFSKDEHGRRAPPILFDILQVAITDSEIDQSSTRLWTFKIELHYGEIKWVIKRTIIEFYNLHLTLKFKAAGIGSHLETPPSFPSQLAHLCNAALTSMRITRGGGDEDDDELWTNVTNKRRAALEQYLKDLVHNSRLVVNYDLCEFLEIGAISIVKDMGWKGKEGYIEHKINPRSLKLRNAIKWVNHWTKDWFILRDSYIAISKDVGSTLPSDILLFDSHLKIKRSIISFAPYHQTHITISNSTRRIEVKGPTNKHMEEWMECLEKIQDESPWVREHRYKSYAPIRQNAKVKWFVDGHEYFEAVAEALLSAKSEIYIEDWWLSPELYLRRPPKGNEEYRLDRLLKRKATEGVMIYIVIYKNMSVALPLDSQHTRDWLHNLHRNIKVLRHSDLTSPLWAHHEKILVIDCRLAFIGGLDLCFGRYDTHTHDLTDFSPKSECYEIFPGQDYSNPRIKDFIKVSEYNKEVIDKQSAPRMPWHDVHIAMVGTPARDIARHFIQRWNYIKSNRAKDNDIPLLLPKGEYVSPSDENKFKGTCRTQIIRSSAEWSLGIEREYSIYNAYMECISKAKHFIYIENQFFITATHNNDKLIKNKIGEAIVDRIERAHQEQRKFRVFVVIPCAPGFEGDFASTDRRSMPLRSVAQYQYMSISRGGSSILEQLQKRGIPAEEYISFYSLRNWGRIKKSSAAKMVSPMTSGILFDPSSPTSTTGGGTDYSRNNSLDQTNGVNGIYSHGNSVNSSLNNNIGSSFNSNYNNGKMDSKISNGTKSTTKSKKSKIRSSVSSLTTIRNGNNNNSNNDNNNNYTNGNSNNNSQIEDEFPNQQQSTFQQRQNSRSNSEDRWDTMNDGRMDYVTEQIYIHSKLMIIDDKTVICGSANLNDRSQLGNRDSEIAVVIEDTDLVKSKMNGQEYKAARFALTLRMHLFKEHLGLLPEKLDQHNESKEQINSQMNADNLVMDPLDDNFFYNVWEATATNNTSIYRRVFHCVPDDTVLTFEYHRRFVPDPSRIPPGHIANPWRMNCEDVVSNLNKIRGHLVTFPTQYLSQENMTTSLVQEAVPFIIFT